MSSYEREWNKCTSCGYMELQEVTKNRIFSLIDPDMLSEPFIDPITVKMIDKVNGMKVDSDNINSQNKSTKCNNCSCAD